SPWRSGVQATRQPLIEGAFTARVNSLASTSYESGARSSEPAMAETMKATSATVRAIGPTTPRESQISVRGWDGTRPGVVRKPTPPQEAAGPPTRPPDPGPGGAGPRPGPPPPRGPAARAAAAERRIPWVTRGTEPRVERVPAGAELGRIRLAHDNGPG